jgi:hypothetical protein
MPSAPHTKASPPIRGAVTLLTVTTIFAACGGLVEDEPACRQARVCPHGDTLVGQSFRGCFDPPAACYSVTNCSGTYYCSGLRPPTCKRPTCPDGDEQFESIVACRARSGCYEVAGCGETIVCRRSPDVTGESDNRTPSGSDAADSGR